MTHTDAANDTRSVLQRYLDALVAGDQDAIENSFAEDATWWLHGSIPLAGLRRGRNEILDFLRSGAALYRPGTQRFILGELTAEGDRAVLEWRVEGIAAATGKRYANEYCGVFVVREGRIFAVREYLDTQHAAETLYG